MIGMPLQIQVGNLQGYWPLNENGNELINGMSREALIDGLIQQIEGWIHTGAVY